MIHLLGKVPIKCTIAFSGGVDSVAAFDFLSNGKRDIELAFFDHGTTTSSQAKRFVEKFAADRGIPLKIGSLSREKNPDESLEEFWRNERYRFFHSFETAVVTAHHLDDAVETWIFNSLHGNPRLIPHSNRNVIRPFLLTQKSELINWCQRRKLYWIEDESNKDLRFNRNLIRHKIVPEALKVNPGLHKTVYKKYLVLRNEDEKV